MFVVTIAVTTPARPPFITRNTPAPLRMLTNSVELSPRPRLTLLAVMVRIFCVGLTVSCVKPKRPLNAWPPNASVRSPSKLNAPFATSTTMLSAGPPAVAGMVMVRFTAAPVLFTRMTARPITVTPATPSTSTSPSA